MMWNEMKKLLETFARKSLDPWTEHFQQTLREMRDDREINSFFKDFRTVLVKYVRNPELLEKEGQKADDELRDIVNRARDLSQNEHFK
jgi:hypothetical protein